jgi:starvation-inducible outer membrane lipoprotein
MRPVWAILGTTIMLSPPSLRSGLLLVLLCVAACATGRGPHETLEPLPSAATLVRSPDAYRGRTFGFGGEIVSLLQTDDRTLIEVELLAFDRRGRPRVPRQAVGRVFLRTEEKVESSGYLPGRGVVGVARFTGLSQADVDGEATTYPLLDLLDHRVVRDLSGHSYPRFQFGVGFSLGL